MSLALTIINIICIIITGIAILRLKEVTPEKIPQSFSRFWKTDVRSRRGKYNRLEEEDALIEEGLSFGLEGTIIKDLFEEAQKDEDMKQIKRWVVATQNMKKARRPHSFTILDQDNKVVRSEIFPVLVIIYCLNIRSGPGYRVNKTILLRQQQLRKMKDI